jgi:hypothetical protein
VVINPNSGPESRPDLPDEQYQRALPYLQEFPNVTLVGYILTWYGKREINVAKTDIDTYWNWDGIAREKGIRPLGLDGIFVDEVTCNGENMEYYETLYSYIKSKMWRSGTPGLLSENVFNGRIRPIESRLCTTP